MWQVNRVAETGSTNADVAELARGGAPEGTAVVAEHQIAGRGRLGRAWETPAGTSLTASFLLRPTDVAPSRWPWLPLLVGVAVVEAVRACGLEATLKWPNDVLARDRKLAGILVERVETPSGTAAVVGVGLNVSQSAELLPPGATSLALEGVRIDRDEILGALTEELSDRYGSWRSAGGDPEAGLGAAYRERCSTLGRRVRAELPGGDAAEGRAVDIDDSGRIVLDTRDGVVAVGAGDIVHLRPA